MAKNFVRGERYVDVRNGKTQFGHERKKDKLVTQHTGKHETIVTSKRFEKPHIRRRTGK